MVPLEPLLASLDVYGRDADVCAAVIALMQLVVRTTDFPTLFDKYEGALTAAAQSPDTALALLAAEALRAGLADDTMALLVQSTFFPAAIRCIVSANLEVSDALFRAVRGSAVYQRYPAAMEDLLRGAADEQGTDEAQLRALEVLCCLRRQMPNSASIYSGLDAYLGSRDLLHRLCALQIVVQNADCAHDFAVLAGEGGILEGLVGGLAAPAGFQVDDEPVYCKTLQLVAKLLRVPGTNWGRLADRLVSGLGACLAQDGEAQKEAVFVVGCMAANGSLRSRVSGDLKAAFFDLFGSSAHATRAACLNAAAAALDPATDDGLKAELLGSAIGSMGPDSPFDSLRKACMSIDDGVKDAAYHCLFRLLGQRRFAEQALAQSAILLFLIDRRADDSAAGLQWKHAIIAMLVEQAWAPELLNEPMRQSLGRYLAQGVYYCEAVPAVALI